MAQNGVKKAIGDDNKCAENFCGVLTFLCYIRPLLNSGTMNFPRFCGLKTRFSTRECKEKQRQKKPGSAGTTSRKSVSRKSENTCGHGRIDSRPTDCKIWRHCAAQRCW